MSNPFVNMSLPGQPRGKGRPRFGKAGSFVRVWTDKKTVSYEEELAAVGRIAMQGRPPRLGALAVTIEAAMSIPESWPKKKRSAAVSGDVSHIGKPDFDNIAKIVGDALNGIVWKDDSQIIVCSFHKFYAIFPCLTVWVWEWHQ